MLEQQSIPIVFDKSHLLTIGERLYSTGLDLVRELVSNAYDADATRVEITLAPETITVSDNGSGMDEQQLRRYCTIGSTEKRVHTESPKFKRRRIGEFGIGKFSALAAARRFSVETQQKAKRFRGRLVFDADQWTSNADNWSIPFETLSVDAMRPDGTVVTLERISKPLERGPVIRHIRERMPIGKDDFRIFVNDVEITPTTVPGRRFPVNIRTPFGPIEGEVILANLPLTQRNIADAGITVRVRHVAIAKSLFGFEGSHAFGVNRLRGFVNADFLPITSSRDSFIYDTNEYKMFEIKMKEVMRTVIKEARNEIVEKENQQASHVLRDALDKIGKALKKNPDALDETRDPPLGMPAIGGGGNEEGYAVSKAMIVDSNSLPPIVGEENVLQEHTHDKKQKRRHLGLAQKAIIRKMRFRNLGVVCRMERFGPECPPSFCEEGVFLINIDHPRYVKQKENTALLTMFIATLITKELTLQKHPQDASAAYALQHQLLTDGFKDVRKL